MNRRQKAIEDRCKDRHSRGPVLRDKRTFTTLQYVQKQIIFYRNWNTSDEEIGRLLMRNYKNGADLFDLAIQIENSPLMKALS